MFSSVTRQGFAPAAVAAALVAFSAAPASAAIMVATYQGVVAGGDGASNAFGASFSSLSGSAFTATFTYDTELGLRGPHNGGDYLRGGARYGVESPLIGATFTLNGHNLNFTGSYDAWTWNGATLVQHVAEDRFTQNGVDYVHRLYLDLQELSLPGSVDMPFSTDTYFWNSGSLQLTANGGQDRSSFVLIADRIDVTTLSAVPEPMTWGLMITGFGLAGVALRRGRANAHLLKPA